MPGEIEVEDTLKCFLEFIDCNREYDCLSCEIAKQYWSSLSEQDTDLENTSVESNVNVQGL